MICRRSFVVERAATKLLKLLWFDEDNTHALMYYCGSVMEDGECDRSLFFIKVLRRAEVKTEISLTSLDHMSIALRTACLEPGDLHVSDQRGRSFFLLKLIPAGLLCSLCKQFVFA